VYSLSLPRLERAAQRVHALLAMADQFLRDGIVRNLPGTSQYLTAFFRRLILAMHFDRMLAFRLLASVEYQWPTVLVASLVAMLACAAALYVASRQKMSQLSARALQLEAANLALRKEVAECEQGQESVRLFRILIDNTNDAIEVVDPETLHFIDVNARACSDLGYSREELLSLTIYDITSFGDSLLLRVNNELQDSGSTVFECIHQRKDGSRFPVEVSIKQVQLDRLYRVCVVRDITERKRAEEELQKAKDKLALVTRMQAMGELAGAIAHEVNQPLTAIITNANFCLRRLAGATPDPDQLHAAITEIVNDASRASAVISRIRGVLTRWTPQKTELDVNQVIQEVTHLVSHELNRHRVSWSTDLAADLPRVRGDAVQLQQVLINLILNAVEAMKVSAERPREILIRSARNAHGVLVQVQDSGPGVESELANRIFEPFFTTKPEGTGMGLSISRSIVQSHGGELMLISSSLGALFQFTLPGAGTPHD
jgi:PAS domain S-box-containing protein